MIKSGREGAREMGEKDISIGEEGKRRKGGRWDDKVGSKENKSSERES